MQSSRLVAGIPLQFSNNNPMLCMPVFEHVTSVQLTRCSFFLLSICNITTRHETWHCETEFEEDEMKIFFSQTIAHNIILPCHTKPYHHQHHLKLYKINQMNWPLNINLRSKWCVFVMYAIFIGIRMIHWMRFPWYVMFIQAEDNTRKNIEWDP